MQLAFRERRLLSHDSEGLFVAQRFKRLRFRIYARCEDLPDFVKQTIFNHTQEIVCRAVCTKRRAADSGKLYGV